MVLSDPPEPDAAARPDPAPEPDILERIDALLPVNHPEPDPGGGIVPSADIWDDDDWMPDAQTVIHGPDGEPLEEPLDDPVYDARTDEAMASRMARWGRESVLGAGMAGAGRAIESFIRVERKTEIVIEVEADRTGPDDPVSLYLVDEHPEESVAIVRPWLLGVPRRRRRRGQAARQQAAPAPDDASGEPDQPELG
jgi:hypothetical protein